MVHDSMTVQHPRRKVWQHDVSKVSMDQLCEALHRQGWEADVIGDYGEDFLVRIFENGHSTGEAFYIQLKGTDDISRHRLKQGDFTYSVETVALEPWHKNPLPVVFVLWDNKTRTGNWLHIQPFVSVQLSLAPNWLDHNKAKKRSVRLPASQRFGAADCGELRKTIRDEFRSVALGRQALEQTQRDQLDALRYAIEEKINNQFERQLSSPVSSTSNPLPLRVQQRVIRAQCEAMVEENANDVAAWARMAEACYDLQDFDEALRAVNRAWDLRPESAELFSVRGCIYAEYAIAHGGSPRKMLDEAKRMFEALRSLHPQPPVQAIVAYNIGNCLSALGRYAEAVLHYDVSLTMCRPDGLRAQVWKNRGTAYSLMDDTVEAVKSFEKALEYDPALFQAYASWSLTEVHRGNFVKARDLLEKAFLMNPGEESLGSGFLYTLAMILSRVGDLRGAYGRVSQYLRAQPTSRDAMQLKAFVVSGLWREDPTFIEEAIRFFTDLITEDEADTLGRIELYLLHQRQGDPEVAEQVMEAANVGLDAPVAALYRYALYLQARGQLADAITYLEAALLQGQKHRIVHTLGKLKQEIGDYAGAINYYEQACRSSTSPIPILRSITDCCFLQRDYLACVHWCTRAILAAPGDCNFWNNLAYALIQLRILPLVGLTTFVTGELGTNRLEPGSELDLYVEDLLEMLRRSFGEKFVGDITVA
jgi:tetratricopeptide (TPR) repeat protein